MKNVRHWYAITNSFNAAGDGGVSGIIARAGDGIGGYFKGVDNTHLFPINFYQFILFISPSFKVANSSSCRHLST